jgi:hypothetical protein
MKKIKELTMATIGEMAAQRVKRDLAGFKKAVEILKEKEKEKK